MKKIFAVIIMCLFLVSCSGNLEPQLFQAVENNDVQKVKTLLQQGADPNKAVSPQNSFPVITIAAEKNNVEIVKLLIEHGAKVNVEPIPYYRIQPLVQASIHGNLEVMKILISNGADINGNNPYSNTNMMLAIEAGQDKSVKLLLQYGADPNIRNQFGASTFDGVCYLGDIELVNEMVKYGAKINSEHPKYNITPLMNAAESGKIDVAKYLVEHGADYKVADSEGKTAADYAKENKHDTVVSYLSSLP